MIGKSFSWSITRILDIFLADLFFILDDFDFANFADDNIPYACGENLDDS